MRIPKEFFLDVMFTDKLSVVEKSHEEHLCYTTSLYVFEGNTRIAILEREITDKGTNWFLKEGIYEQLKAML
ncbi:hypothetical protein OFDDKENP_00153 [Aeromonas phage B614]|nr:hypothetical protein OFDDKENP_00153 [Aeromonas phage B614]UYD58119.1 hypothetical protein JNEOFJEA_00022 [Aeromonas phage UP87]UYD58483.1 hypothetical protein IPAKJDPM_00140 [Aeromonas phage avDM14-QBC]UYD58699.1 hypothetical protein HNNIDBEH_00106 [Aeromonas phage avDM10-HWA]UYD58998.1 hypothetical protein OFOPOMKI_00148 [Aeromonas phage avDM7-IJDJ]UYD59810.1 hypothetical protein LEHPIFIF_00037 [Aeromonas phage avDM9-HANS]